MAALMRRSSFERVIQVGSRLPRLTDVIRDLLCQEKRLLGSGSVWRYEEVNGKRIEGAERNDGSHRLVEPYNPIRCPIKPTAPEDNGQRLTRAPRDEQSDQPSD